MKNVRPVQQSYDGGPVRQSNDGVGGQNLERPNGVERDPTLENGIEFGGNDSTNQRTRLPKLENGYTSFKNFNRTAGFGADPPGF